MKENELTEITLHKNQIDLNALANQIINLVCEKISHKTTNDLKILFDGYLDKLTNEKPEKYLTQKDVCERLNFSPTTLYRREKTGAIVRDMSNGKTPFYSEKQIEKYLRTTNQKE